MAVKGEKQLTLEITDSLDFFSFLPSLTSTSDTDAPLLPSFSVPAKSPGFSSLRYKTELCTRYAESGFCAYKNRCQFAHGLSELRPPIQHPKYKTELCRSFHILGTCNYGLRCLFIHSPHERREPPVSPDTLRLPTRRHAVPYNKERCRLWRSPGGCPYGSCCHFQHPKGAQEPCRHFTALGDCPYGARCHFSHSPPQDRWSIGTKNGRGSLSPSDPGSDPGTPVPTDAPANNAFNFSSCLLPLALRLQILGEEEDFASDQTLTDPNYRGLLSD
ncbi:mRNA decay activator protein ZFP36L2-like [Spea bombifrons]|uniref:mRNA decay activator protein ZFP36L2-like n=1 Tax=Spea bombifrons TaxID=233779 RepID=UPI00234B14DC|nr:mRNA decay activator protein ZFP36L2-like [Spea bombifrons]